MKLDVLVFSAHPDDAELGASGTIVKLISQNKKVGVIDLTRGELGSRGSAELRKIEAAKASEVLQLSVRENLGFRDGFFKNDEEHQLKVIQKIRQYQPEIILANAPSDRHPDHGRASELVKTAGFLSGLLKIETKINSKNQQHWRAEKTFYYIQDRYIQPDFVIDISEFWETKLESIKAYSSQFFKNNDDESVQTYISSERFWHFLEARARSFGHFIESTYGEGFLSENPLKVNGLMDLV